MHEGYKKIAAFMVLGIFFGGFSAFSVTQYSVLRTQHQDSSRPQRIVSINLCADEYLLSVADPEQVAAVTQLEKSPEAEAAALRVRHLARIRGTAEEVLSLKPDLVLLGRFTSPDTRAMMSRLEIRTEIVEVPANFDEIAREIQKMGDLTGHADRAEGLIKKLPAKGAAPLLKRALFYQRGGHVPGNATFEDSILKAAGVVNIAAERGIDGYGTLSVESLIELKPDLVILPLDQQREISVERAQMNHPAIRIALPGVKILEIPSYYLNCGTPASLDVVRQIREAFA